MTIDTDLVLIILFAAVALTLGVVFYLNFRLSRFLRGKEAKSLEESIIKHGADIEKFKAFRKELEEYLDTVEQRLDASVRGVGTVRFNPFKGSGEGGQMSFATAFLDEKENGVVLSTLSTRERLGVYAKPLRNGISEYELTGEEMQAIKSAKERLNNQDTKTKKTGTPIMF